MKLFLDTSDPSELEWAQSLGVVRGVTMNPVLIEPTGKTPIQVLRELLSVAGPHIESISVPLSVGDADETLDRANDLVQLSRLVCLKIGISERGLSLSRLLAMRGVQTNVTSVFNVPQAVLAHCAGARYVSMFVSRLEAATQDGCAAIRAFSAAQRHSARRSEIIAASLRTGRHVADAFEAGADIATVSPTLLRGLAAHPLTDNFERECHHAAQSYTSREERAERAARTVGLPSSGVP